MFKNCSREQNIQIVDLKMAHAQETLEQNTWRTNCGELSILVKDTKMLSGADTLKAYLTLSNRKTAQDLSSSLSKTQTWLERDVWWTFLSWSEPSCHVRSNKCLFHRTWNKRHIQQLVRRFVQGQLSLSGWRSMKFQINAFYLEGKLEKIFYQLTSVNSAPLYVVVKFE